MSEAGADAFSPLGGPGAEDPIEWPPSVFDWDELNNCSDNGMVHHQHAPTGFDNSMLQSWLADPNRPWSLAAEQFRFPEHRGRALAEIDGMYAGLTFLDKVEKDDGAEWLGSLAGFDDVSLLALGSQQHR